MRINKEINPSKALKWSLKKPKKPAERLFFIFRLLFPV